MLDNAQAWMCLVSYPDYAAEMSLGTRLGCARQARQATLVPRLSTYTQHDAESLYEAKAGRLRCSTCDFPSFLDNFKGYLSR